MVGRMYVKAPVSSNMMTTTVTVILMTPLFAIQFLGLVCEPLIYLRAAAAPRNAYVPGVMHGTSGWQTANMPECSWSL